MATPQIRAPRPYSVGDDFALWTRRFEAYARSVKIPEAQLSNALLALLDDAAFRAYDLLGLAEDTSQDYKLLIQALSKRFSPCTGQQELRWLLGQRMQEAEETLDAFADALIHLANRAYPNTDVKLRMELVRDRFVAGVRSEYVQEALLRSPPETLDDARYTARRVEAAQSARRRMRPRRAEINTTTSGEAVTVDVAGNTPTRPPDEVAAVGVRRDDLLADAIRRNTEMLEKLILQLTHSDDPDTTRPSTQPPRRRLPATCWSCGRRGHLRRDCPSGNAKRPTPWVERQPRAH